MPPDAASKQFWSTLMFDAVEFELDNKYITEEIQNQLDKIDEQVNSSEFRTILEFLTNLDMQTPKLIRECKFACILHRDGYMTIHYQKDGRTLFKGKIKLQPETYPGKGNTRNVLFIETFRQGEWFQELYHYIAKTETERQRVFEKNFYQRFGEI